jgi:hypothetical protein
VHAYELFSAQFLPEVNRAEASADRLAAVVRAYVRFAGSNRPLFELLSGAGIDKARHPEVKTAEKPLNDAVAHSVRAITGDNGEQAENLATTLEATAHGHATLLLDGDFGEGPEAVELAAERAARATLALIKSRELLDRPSVSRDR